MTQQSRKQFPKTLGLATVSGLALPPVCCLAQTREPTPEAGTREPRNDVPATTPSYLRGYETLYRENPRAAAVEWHRNAKWGLFVHHALESLRGLKARDVLQTKSVDKEAYKKSKNGSAAEYALLKDRFTAEKFDADFITNLALQAQMHYVNFTTLTGATCICSAPPYPSLQV